MDHLVLLKMAVAALSVIFVSVDKAGFGGGVGILAMPIMALVIPPKECVGIMLPLLCACDAATIWHYRKSWDRRNVTLLIPGAAAGVAAGTLALGRLSDHWLGAAMGAISVAYVLRHIWLAYAANGAAPSRPTWSAGSAFGFAAGVTSTIAHAAGPVTTMYLLPQRLDRKRFVGTTVIFYAFLNAAKIPSYLLTDVIRFQTLRSSLFLLPCVPLGVVLGIWANTRIREAWFNRAIYTILLLAGIELLWKHIGALV